MQAPRPRALGKSAAKGPNDRLQADLIDFSQNTRGKTKYGLVVMDVFTREAAVVGRATGHDRPGQRVRHHRELPTEAVHRTKRPEDRNATAVVDRGIQTLKKDLRNLDKFYHVFSSCRATCPSSARKLGQGTWTTAGCRVTM